MYNNLQSNPFQRETDLLEQPEIREEIMMIYLASFAIAQNSWQEALSHIAKYRQMIRHSRLEKQQALQLQIQFMQTFCAFKMDKLAQAQKMIQKLLESIIQNVGDKSRDRSLSKSNSQDNSFNHSLGNITQRQFSYKAFAVKCYTLAANIIITQQKTELDFKQIKKGLLQLLEPEEMKQFIPQVLGSLTGCKYFKPVVDLKQFDIFLKQNSNRAAKKMQILADWKYLAGRMEQAIQFKKKAVQLWEALSSHKQLTQCRKQLNELSANSSKSSYKLRLARIKVFAQSIIKLEPPFDPNNINRTGLSLIKLYLPILLDQLSNENDEKIKPKQSMMASQSKIKKQNLLDRISRECEVFYQVYKEQKGGETTNLLLNSKFVDENFKKVRKLMSVFPKLRALRLREVFNRLKRVQQKNSKLLKAAVISKFKASYLS